MCTVQNVPFRIVGYRYTHLLILRSTPARQEQRNINRTKSTKLVANHQKIGSKSAQSVNIWSEKQRNERMGHHAQVFPHKYRRYGQIILPKIIILSCRDAEIKFRTEK